MRLLGWLTAGFYFLVAISGLSALGLALLFFITVRNLPQVPVPLSRIIEIPPTEVFDTNGQRVMTLGGRDYVPLERISSYFVQAIIATEDHRFWNHRGVDKLRTLKALWITLTAPGRVQGASTITQQLAKNLFFSLEQTYTRKFRELLVALQIESQFTKQQILEAYINQIPFGVGAYGIEPAARIYFDKSAAQLSLAEASLLAGLPKSPSGYNPFRHLDRAKQRQEVVLQRMVAVGFITPEEALTARSAELELSSRRSSRRRGGYFLDYVLKTLEDQYGPEVLYHGGLKVTTTLDPHYQTLAEAAVHQGLDALEQLLNVRGPEPSDAQDSSQRPQAALAALEVNTGAIRALVGGRDYQETEYNRAVQNTRQPGSGFKPFLYYAAFKQLGLSPASLFEDRAVKIPVAGRGPWQPKNFEGDHQGPLILKQAFTESINTVAAQLVAQVGPAAVVEVAHKCGITSPIRPVLSVALGTSGASPLEMASAYSTFAGGGVWHKPFCIWRVEDAFGHVLHEHIVSRKQVLDERIAYQVTDMMAGVVDQGTGNGVRRLGFKGPAAGKTGTTDDFRDAWFTGFTPTLCASVWVGYDRQKGLYTRDGAGITGGTGAVPIWTRFMQKASEVQPQRTFHRPEGVELVKINPITGQRAGFFSRNPVEVVLRQEQLPP